MSKTLSDFFHSIKSTLIHPLGAMCVLVIAAIAAVTLVKLVELQRPGAPAKEIAPATGAVTAPATNQTLPPEQFMAHPPTVYGDTATDMVIRENRKKSRKGAKP
jgi:hypothetical protein